MLHDICPAIEPLGSFKGFREELYLLDTIQAKGTVSLTQAAVANQVPVPFPSYNAIWLDLAVGDLIGMGTIVEGNALTLSNRFAQIDHQRGIGAAFLLLRG